MVDLHGTGVSAGIRVGPVLRVAGPVPVPPDQPFDGDRAAESERALAALQGTAAELEQRAAGAGKEVADVLLAQAMMARDPMLGDAVRKHVHDGVPAARAVFLAFGAYREALAATGPYLAARVADLDDIRDRTVARLLDVRAPGLPESDHPFVLVARDLAPADTAVLDPAKVLAFVTEEGSPTSHTAILARSIRVPAVVACPGATGLSHGTVVIVDGGAGLVRVDPSPAELAGARAATTTPKATPAAVFAEGRTSDGHLVPLLANVGRPADIAAVVEAGAEGVGLYRTEFLFLDRAEPPGEDEQVESYRSVLAAFPAGRVVVRVLDPGADKPLRFLPAAGESNPALGERGLRMLRRHPEVLATQLRALRRAAEGTSARLEVMAPMVSDAEDARWFAAACRSVGLTDLARVGVMVEVPAAALRSDRVAAEVDFLSLGTNDLAQYTFAADRQLGALARLQDPWQPALLDLVAAATRGASRVHRDCGVCGEAAADPALACVLVGLGATSLSMGAAALPQVRAALAAHGREQCREAAEVARAADTSIGARTAAREALPGLASPGE
jgi:phosphoenolpyruvate-protein phosphotransferase (PTS system enzyme I)